MILSWKVTLALPIFNCQSHNCDYSSHCNAITASQVAHSTVRLMVAINIKMELKKKNCLDFRVDSTLIGYQETILGM